MNILIFKSAVSGGPYAIAATLIPTATTWTDTNVDSIHTYCYVTRAIDANGNMSAASAETCATTPFAVPKRFAAGSQTTPTAAPDPAAVAQ